MLKHLKIKVCGMKYPDNIRAVDALGVEYLGFIFYPKSKRDASLLNPEVVHAILAKKVGVFVSENFEFILKKIKDYHLDAVQLHGEESPELCAQLKAQNVEVFKVFSVDDDFDFSILEAYKKHVDYFLFDTKGKEKGGNGVSFNWELLRQYDNEVPLILSGGINPSNIETALALSELNLYALDLNSGFESEPGIKNSKVLSETLRN